MGASSSALIGKKNPGAGDTCVKIPHMAERTAESEGLVFGVDGMLLSVGWLPDGRRCCGMGVDDSDDLTRNTFTADGFALVLDVLHQSGAVEQHLAGSQTSAAQVSFSI